MISFRMLDLAGDWKSQSVAHPTCMSKNNTLLLIIKIIIAHFVYILPQSPIYA